MAKPPPHPAYLLSVLVAAIGIGSAAYVVT
jgi:hypothetical protein